MKYARGRDVHVYLTENTLRGMMLEKARHPGLECIIQMIGRRVGNNYYYDLVADSGMHATHTYAMCEKDHSYCDHLCTRMAEYYDFPMEELVVSQVHSHPPDCLCFSNGDGPANRKLAKQYGGVTNGLMWVNPEFHIQFWHIDENGKETPVSYTVDDEAVFAAMPKKSLAQLKLLVEQNEAGVFRVPTARTQAERGKKTFWWEILSLHRKEKMKMQENIWTAAPEEVEDDFQAMMDAMRPYTLIMPEELQQQRSEGPLYGFYHPETRTFNVVTHAYMKARPDTQEIGVASKSPFVTAPEKRPFMQIFWGEDGPQASVFPEQGDEGEANVTVETYHLQQDVFSRNTGILEAQYMADKQAIIPGVGSGGFFVGLELVKAGIGSVIVADDDVLAYHNVGRHVCGIHDVGRYKVDLFRERAADINPDCKVYTFRDLLQHVDPKELEDMVWPKSIILCCADNRHAGYVCNELADRFHIPMVDAGCGPRASSGEIFYYKPDSGMACYTCAYGEDVGVDHSNQQVRRKFYATEAQLEKMHFQPGMSLDIEQTAIMETKLAIDLLMEDQEGYEPKLLPYLNQCTLLLNYPVSREVNPYMQLFEGNGRVPLPMTWKTGSAEKNPHCSHCGGK